MLIASTTKTYNLITEGNKINNSQISNKIDIFVKDISSTTRIDKYIKLLYPKIPYSIIQKFIRKGLIKLNSKKYKYDGIISSNDVISIPKLLFADNQFQNLKTVSNKIIPKKLLHNTIEILKNCILYKNDAFIIINKPFGLAVQGGTKVSISIADCLEGLKFEYSNKPHIVHRLDKDTTGILVIARTKKAATDISYMLSNNQIEKKYNAIAYDNLKETEFSVNQPLAKAIDNYEIMEIDYSGKEAKTHFTILNRSPKSKTVFLEAILETGRKHQIRAHLALACNSPIIGDFKYGYKKNMSHNCNIMRIMLHSYSIKFIYNEETILVKAPLPEDFINAISILGLNYINPLN